MSKEDSIESTQKGLRAIQELDYWLSAGAGPQVQQMME